MQIYQKKLAYRKTITKIHSKENEQFLELSQIINDIVDDEENTDFQYTTETPLSDHTISLLQLNGYEVTTEVIPLEDETERIEYTISWL